MTDIDPLSILASIGDAEIPDTFPGLGEILLVLAGILLVAECFLCGKRIFHCQSTGKPVAIG